MSIFCILVCDWDIGRDSSPSFATSFHVHTNFVRSQFKKCLHFPNYILLYSTFSMATASVIPRNLSLFFPNHHHARVFTPKNFRPTKFLDKKIHSELLSKDSNGVPIRLSKDCTLYKTSHPITVLGPNSKFLYSSRRTMVRSMSSDSGITTTSLQSKVKLSVFSPFLDFKALNFGLAYDGFIRFFAF